MNKQEHVTPPKKIRPQKTQTLELADKDFKRTMINMRKDLIEKVDNVYE